MAKEILGCLGTGETETDFILDSGNIDILPKLYQQDNIRFEYNQGNQTWSKVSCTIFAAIGMASDLMNYEFSLDEIKEIDELSYTKGRTRGKGWRVKNAVHLVYEWWNANEYLVKKYGKIAYYRTSKYSELPEEIIKLGYDLDTNYCPTVEYAKDYYLDGVLDGYQFGSNTNGHSVCFIHDGVRKIKDNYKGRKNPNGQDVNVYEVKNPICKLTNFSGWLYLYTKVSEDNLEEVKRLNEFRVILLQTIENNSKLWHLTNDRQYQKILNQANIENRKKINDIDKQLALLH